MPPQQTQVLVVGGGPAGSSAAWHCAQRGLDVCLVDKAQFPRAKPCAEYVSPEGSRILAAMGALDALEQGDAAQLTGMVVHAPNGAQIHGEFVARHGFRGFRDRGLGVRREVLDTLLLERARAAGVRVYEQVAVAQVACGGDGRVQGVTLRDGTTITASVVIGADGLRSVVARRLGLAHVARWPRRVALVAHYDGVRDMGTLGEMHVTRRGYVGLAQVSGGLTNVALVVPAWQARAFAGDPAAALEAWLAAQPTLAPRFARATRVTPVRATGPFASRARRAWAPGALLVGDAADFFDPFTGEGIYAALRGGELVAEAALAMTQATTRRALNAAGAQYTQARHAAFAGKWRVERLIGTAVAFPALLNHAARVLSRDRDLADLLIGVTGDFVPPSAVLRPRTLLRLLWPPRRPDSAMPV
jgi:flavin-dependent dehydrogenase